MRQSHVTQKLPGDNVYVSMVYVRGGRDSTFFKSKYVISRNFYLLENAIDKQNTAK